MDYNVAQIRKLIEEALTPDQFNDLVFDHFNDLYENFTGIALPERRRELVNYAFKQRKVQELLNAIEQINETVFQMLRL